MALVLPGIALTYQAVARLDLSTVSWIALANYTLRGQIVARVGEGPGVQARRAAQAACNFALCCWAAGVVCVACVHAARCPRPHGPLLRTCVPQWAGLLHHRPVVLYCYLVPAAFCAFMMGLPSGGAVAPMRVRSSNQSCVMYAWPGLALRRTRAHTCRCCCRARAAAGTLGGARTSSGRRLASATTAGCVSAAPPARHSLHARGIGTCNTGLV